MKNILRLVFLCLCALPLEAQVTLTQPTGTYVDNQVPRRNGLGAVMQSSDLTISDVTGNVTTVATLTGDLTLQAIAGVGASTTLERGANGNFIVTPSGNAGAKILNPSGTMLLQMYRQSVTDDEYFQIGSNVSTIQMGTFGGGAFMGPTGTTPLVVRMNNNATITVTNNSATGMRFNGYGAGAATFDASGNITSVSDERLKDIDAPFTRGLSALRSIRPISYHWKESTHLDRTESYSGFSAQNVAAAVPEAVAVNAEGMLSLQDRTLLAVLVNAVNELDTLTRKQAAQITLLAAGTGGATVTNAAPAATTDQTFSVTTIISDGLKRQALRSVEQLKETIEFQKSAAAKGQ